MPITGKQFELGIDPKIEEWMRKIHSFLNKHKDEAFTEDELGEQLDALSEKYKKVRAKGEDDFAVARFDSTFEAALEKLLEISAANSRLVRGVSYYRVGQEPLNL